MKNKKFDSIEEDVMDIAKKEAEISKLYNDEIEDDYEETSIEEVEEIEEDENLVEDNIYETDEEEYLYDDKKYKRTKRIINIVFSIIVIILLLVAIDIVAVAKFNVGPFFSIPVHKYDDGGTKEYYGLGYKVIKYNQVQGRRDREIGSWNLKYNVNAITIKDVDLALEFSDNETKAYQSYYKKFVRIISTLQKVDNKNHTITIGYKDEGGKYSLDIKCNVVKDQTNLKELKVGEETTIIGTVKDFKLKSKKQPNKLIIDNCFVEQ